MKGALGISNDVLKSKLLKKGLLKGTSEDKNRKEDIVYSTDKSKKNAEWVWRTWIINNNRASKTVNIAGVLNSRLAALEQTIRECGIMPIFAYFKKRWPHLICCEKPCRPRIREIIFKLCYSNHLLTLNGNGNGSKSEVPKFKTIVVNPGSGGIAAVEKAEIFCSFHPDRSVASLIGKSKTPICKGCKLRATDAVKKGELRKGMREEEILSWLQKQSTGESE